jgi:hypothetical protein
MEVGLGESRIAKTLRHGFGSRCHTAHGIGGVDFDQFLENIVRQLAHSVIHLRPRRRHEKPESQEKRKARKKPFAGVQWVSSNYRIRKVCGFRKP